jgi:hypothetical protein
VQRAGRHQQAAARLRDHPIRWREMLERMIDEGAHALVIAWPAPGTAGEV